MKFKYSLNINYTCARRYNRKIICLKTSIPTIQSYIFNRWFTMVLFILFPNRSWWSFVKSQCNQRVYYFWCRKKYNCLIQCKFYLFDKDFNINKFFLLNQILNFFVNRNNVVIKPIHYTSFLAPLVIYKFADMLLN